MTFSLKSFSVGDRVEFSRSFTRKDFSSFSALSGDNNPLHHDMEFSAKTDFGKPIVPLHMTLAPLSMIAGMVFPGEPSLYLGHDVRAAKAVFYDEEIRYSARVEAINESHGVLSLRVLALRGPDVLLDVAMRVKAQVLQWETPSSLPILKATEPGCAIVTGATGEIGAEVCVALASRGWRLLLQDRGDEARREMLRKRLGMAPDIVDADLASQKGRANLATAAAKAKNVGLFVHCASPVVTAPTDDLVGVNFSALQTICEAILPGMLARQDGAILLISSAAVGLSLPGWESYAGSKIMASNYLDGIDRSCAGYGVRGLTLMPGMVATRFSRDYQGDRAMLLPQEVAHEVLRMVGEKHEAGNAVMLQPGSRVRGSLGFHLNQAVRQDYVASTASDTRRADAEAKVASVSPAGAIACKVLRLPAGTSLAGGGLGITQGWDSLKQIEIVLAIEAALGLQFNSADIESAQRFDDLDALCVKMLSARRANG